MDYKELNINLEGLTKEEALERVTGMIEDAYSGIKKYKVVDKLYSIRDLVIFLHDTCRIDQSEITEFKSSYSSFNCSIKIDSKYVTREDVIDLLSKITVIDKKYLSYDPKIVVFNGAPNMYSLGRVLSIFEHASCESEDYIINAERIHPILGIQKHYSNIHISEKYYTLDSLKETIKNYLETVVDADIYVNSVAIEYYMYRVEKLSFELISGDYLKSIKLNYEHTDYDLDSLFHNLVEIMRGREAEFNPKKYNNESLSNKIYIKLSKNMTIIDIIKRIYDYDPVECVRQFYSNGIDIMDILERLGNE